MCECEFEDDPSDPDGAGTSGESACIVAGRGSGSIARTMATKIPARGAALVPTLFRKYGI